MLINIAYVIWTNSQKNKAKLTYEEMENLNSPATIK